MSTYIRRSRNGAGLTQEQLAEKMGVSVAAVQNWENGRTKIRQDKYKQLAGVLNVPIDELVKELMLEYDDSDLDRWPGFLFDAETNEIIDSLHLNLAQQDLFGLMYLYGSKGFKENEINQSFFEKELKKIPYGFIERVGSIQFMNQADGLKKVLRHVKPKFLLKVLRQNPEEEFNIKKMSKEFICEFIDQGHGYWVDEEEEDERLYFDINMRKARIILPLLVQYEEVHVTDGDFRNPIRKDIPESLLSGIIESCGVKKMGWEKGYFKEYEKMSNILLGLWNVTDYRNVAPEGEKECWMWSVNDKGRRLLEWLEK